MDGVEGKTAAETRAKRTRILKRFLDDEDKPSPGQFADPMISR